MMRSGDTWNCTNLSCHAVVSLRVRGGIARTFGPLFVVLVFVLLLPGAVFLYDAVTYPLSADAGQVRLAPSAWRSHCCWSFSWCASATSPA
jgi:hypothetical protein